MILHEARINGSQSDAIMGHNEAIVVAILGNRKFITFTRKQFCNDRTMDNWNIICHNYSAGEFGFGY